MASQAAQSTGDFAAILLGFDVEGFSRTVEKAALSQGRLAGELAAQQILIGERVVTRLAQQAGLRFADALGDGAVYLRPSEVPSARDQRALQRLQEELKYAHLRETGLAIRTAWSHGQVRLLRPKALMLEHSEILWGPAVARLHAALSGRARGRRAPREPEGGRPGLVHREGEIADLAFVFLRLCRADDWATLEEDRLNAALGLIARWAEHAGGRLERVTQDEKGVHARVGLPPAAAPQVAWRDRLLEPQAALRGLGLDGAVAAAMGPVYRGPSDHGSTIVHGGAVNRAAKLCAAQPPGGLAVHASLALPATHPLPSAAGLVGRDEDLAKCEAWLSGSGPRMVILWGDSGIGKTHLQREILARSEITARALAAGAPARTLDPLGVWFELIAQALAARQPPEADRGWALSVLAAAGLDAAALPLCARALRGMESVVDALGGLAGGERARLTQRALLALISALIADTGPWLIGLDDLQDLDDASISLTVAVLDTGVAVKIIATARPAADEERLAAARGHLSTLELPLAPLEARDIETLIAPLAGRRADVAEVMAISGGNPFHAVQTALALAEDGGADGDRTLGAILDRRIARLDTGEREILRALSVTGRAWRAEDLAAIVDRQDGGGPIAAALDRLARARLVIPAAAIRAGAFEASHRLLAEGVSARTPDGVRLRLAGRAARRLTRLRAQAPALVSTVEIARLWETAGDRGRAAVLYERAARSAAAEGADSACAQGLRRALDLFETASDTDTPRRAIRWLAELSRAQWSLGQVDVANLNARKAIERARREPLVLPRRLRTQALAASGLRIETGQFLGDVAEILVGAVDAGRFGAAVPEAAITRSRGFSALGYGLGLFRLSAAADQVLKRGELLASPGDGRPAAYVLTSRAMVDFVFARWREGEAALAAARSQCASLPAHQLMEWIETTCGIGAHLQGRGERALEHFAVLADLAQRRGSDMHAGWADYASAQTLLALDRPHEAWARLNAADDRLRNVVDRQSHHICLGLRARIAWRLGEVDEALAAAAACGTLGRQLAPTNHTSTEAFSAPALVGALALVGEVSAAQRRLARRLVRRHMAEFGRYALVFPIARPRLALTRGLLLARRSPARARQSLDAALRRANSLGLRFEADLARQAHDLVVDHLA